MVPGSNDSTATVVGVVADIRTTGLESAGSAIAYLPYWSRPPLTPTIMVRAAEQPERLTGLIRSELRTLAPTVPLTRIRTLPGIWTAVTAQRRFQLVVLVTFAVTAIVTVTVGIFGIVAHSLGQRTAEIGLRLALGAEPGNVHRQIVREGLVPVAIGLGIGLALAVALGRVAGSLLYGVRPADPLTLAVVALVLLTVAALASWIPARRATIESVVRGLRTD